MENIWIKIDDIAKAKNRKPRSIRASRIFKEQYITRLVPGLGGQRYEVSYISLEPELQEFLQGLIYSIIGTTSAMNITPKTKEINCFWNYITAELIIWLTF